MKTKDCVVCGRSLPKNPNCSVKIQDGERSCLKCAIKNAESLLRFTEYWLKYKTSSEHGKQVNQTIIDETRKEISILRRKAMSCSDNANSAQ